MLGNLSGVHLLVLVFVILLLFGAPKLPALARSMGQSMRIFRKEVHTMNEDKAAGAAQDGNAVEAGVSHREPELEPVAMPAAKRDDDPTAPKQ